MKEETPPKKLAELVQRTFPWRTQTLELYEDRMQLHVDGPLEHFRMPYYLHVLKDEPDVTASVPRMWLTLSSAALIPGILLGLLGGRPVDSAAGFCLSLAGAISLLLAVTRIRRLHVYFYKVYSSADSPRARYEPQLFLYPDRPSRQEVAGFMELIKIAREKQVEKARTEHEEAIPYARELERFGNLMRDDLVTEQEFSLVKAKLLNLKPRMIGF